MTLMLSLAALSGGLAAHAMEDKDREHSAANQRPSDLQFALVNDAESLHAHQSNREFEAQWEALEEEDAKAQRMLDLFLTQQEEQQKLNNDVMGMVIQESLDAAAKAAISPIESLVPHLDEGDTGKGMDILEEGALNMAIELSLRLSPPELEGLKAEASLPEPSHNPEERDTRKESDAEADRILAELVKARKEEERRKEEQRLLRGPISHSNLQVVVLYKEEEALRVRVSEAERAYALAEVGLEYRIVDSVEALEFDPEGSNEERIIKAKEAWDALAQEHKLILSKLRDAITERNSLLDQYLALDTHEDLAARIRAIRSQIRRLEQEVKEKKSRALDASGETYGEPEEPGAPDEERKHGQETPDDLKAEETRVQSELEAAINEETALIAGYFKDLNPT
jgi:hypothetical protein